MINDDIDWSFEQMACDAIGVDIKELRPGRDPFTGRALRVSDDAASARYICFTYAFNNLNLTEKEIGLRYYRDRTTIMHGLKKYKEFIEIGDVHFKKAVEYFNEKVSKIKIEIVDEKELTESDISTIKFMYREGITSTRISNHYLISREKIKKILESVNRKHRIIPSIIKTEIFVKYDKGETVKSIAEQLDLSYNTVHGIINTQRLKIKNLKNDK